MDKLTATVFIFGLDTVDKTPRRLYNTNINTTKELDQMRPILLVAVILLTGCANTEWLLGNSPRYGYKEYDPCIKCGEKWEQIPPPVHNAQKLRAQGVQW